MTRELFYFTFFTAAGWVGVLSSSQGLQQVTFPQSSETAARHLLGESAYKAKLSKDRLHDVSERFQVYFSGERADFPDRLDLSSATSFQSKVWQAARLIPYGQTQSYQWIAIQIGKIGAARAVGQALGRNPLPVIIPCHRVVASDGGLGGFTGGIEMKKLLLALERTVK